MKWNQRLLMTVYISLSHWCVSENTRSSSLFYWSAVIFGIWLIKAINKIHWTGLSKIYEKIWGRARKLQDGWRIGLGGYTVSTIPNCLSGMLLLAISSLKGTGSVEIENVNTTTRISGTDTCGSSSPLFDTCSLQQWIQPVPAFSHFMLWMAVLSKFN